METNNKTNNTNFGQGGQQLRKRKFNELANGDQPATEGEQKQQQPPVNLSKKKCEQQHGNDTLEVCNLHSRLKIIGL
jgi:hypothetical protein